ncbi:hypothetical protein JKF63_07405 [Porcisia hertigi]|uniref:Uncharacterized protein n=1 Tax=Porcisia hertigi TaxID=2761500 RepID=A0A836YJK0_9TRYP|nr:hypothetical protein JKF63_07405 [Porcisia hertigi]
MWPTAADAAAPPTITIGAALLPMGDSRAGQELTAPTWGAHQQQTRTVITSPSPPMSTCRRLSYNSAKTCSNSRSRMRASSSPVGPSPSRHRPSSQQPPHQQHFWQKRVTVTEVDSTTVDRCPSAVASGDGVVDVVVAGACAKQKDSPIAEEPRSPLIRIGPSATLSSPEAAPADAATQVTAGPNHSAAAEARARPLSCESGAAGFATLEAAHIAPDACEVKSSDGDASPFSLVLTHRTLSSKATTEGDGSASLRSVPVPQSTTAAVTMMHGQVAGINNLSSPSSAAASPRAAAPRSLPARRHSTGATAPTSSGVPVAQSQPRHAAPPPKPRRSRSGSSGVRGAGITLISTLFQPAPTLRNIAVGVPSPFSAGQLVMPRRPQLQPPVGPAGNGAGGAGSKQKTTATIITAAHQRAPGVAAAQDRLQLPRRSRLARTPSTDHVTRGDSARNAVSYASSSLSKRRPSIIAHGGFAEAPVGQATVQRSSRRRRSSTPSEPLPIYTAQGTAGGMTLMGRSELLRPGKGIPAVVPATSGSAAPHQHFLRSNSAPVHHPRWVNSRASAAVPSHVTSRGLRAASGSTAPAVEPSPFLRSASVTSVRQRRSHATTTATCPASGSAPVLKLTRSASMRSVPRRSQSCDRTSATARSRSAGKGEWASLHTATAPTTSRASNVSVPSTAWRGNAGVTRPTINGTAGAAGTRVRPVVSTATGAATGSRRLVGRQPRNAGGLNVVSATPSSMVSMEETKAFLQDFERLNQRELALFGTLLATVASEQQKRGIAKDAAPRVDKADAGMASPTGVITSLKDVSVWMCKRTAPKTSNQEEKHAEKTSDAPRPPPTPEEPGVGVQCVSQADEELIVLVRRSHSRSPTAHALTPLSETRPKADPQHQKQAEGMPPPQPVELIRRGENKNDRTVANEPALLRHPLPCLYGEQDTVVAGCPDNGGAVVVYPGSRSPSPTPPPPPPPANATTLGKENDQQTRSFNSSIRASVLSSSLPTRTTATGAGASQKQPVRTSPTARDGIHSGGKLRPRDPTETNTPANRSVSKAALEVEVAAAMSMSIPIVYKEPPANAAASMHSRRPSDGAHGTQGAGRRRCNLNGDRHLSPAPSPRRQLSVASYTDIMRCHGPHWLEGSHDRGGVNWKEERARLAENPNAADAPVSLPSPSPTVSEAAAPLAALKKAKELAAEQAAAVRAEARAADKSYKTAMPGPSTSLSVISSAASSTSDRVSTGRQSIHCANGEATEISTVRVTASQLRLLIESSRSEANIARYQPP